MSDKPLAVLLAAVAVAPLCVVCILGPAVIGGMFAGWFGWMRDLSIGQTSILGLVVAMVAIGGAKIWRARRLDRDTEEFGESH